MHTDPITAEEARQLFHYNPETGDLTWKMRRRGVRINRPIRADNGLGYFRVFVDGRGYFVHRIVWLMTYGQWPNGNIDHINGNPTDTRIGNLRECTQSQNMRNIRANKRNTSGKKGVSWSTHEQKWIAQIRYGGKKHRLGAYTTVEEAYSAYCEAAREHHGEFANFG
jgi:hypothetical protein